MKLKDLIFKLEEMNCIEQTIETKGDLVNWNCNGDYYLPYNLEGVLPGMKEKQFLILCKMEEEVCG